MADKKAKTLDELMSISKHMKLGVALTLDTTRGVDISMPTYVRNHLDSLTMGEIVINLPAENSSSERLS